MSKVSVIIPSRLDKPASGLRSSFLAETVADCLSKARGDVEVIAVLDGYWPDPPLVEDRRLIQVHHHESLGMRPSIDHGAACANGEWLMKVDDHVMMAEGYDEVLKADCDQDWMIIPRRYRLDPEKWCILESNADAIDYHYLSYPFDVNNKDVGAKGLHGQQWRERTRQRSSVLLDEEMSSQGSCWFMSKRHHAWLGDKDVEHYGNFIQEMQEIGLKTWLGGGKMMLNKKTWYAHLFKGKERGRGYWLSKTDQERGARYAERFWMLDEWKERVHDLRWLIERFAPVPTWPVDLDIAFRVAHEKLAA
jgi:hypothetical protein